MVKGRPYACPRCGKSTGFKYVSKLGTRAVGSYTVEPGEEVNTRASCRFCGYIPPEHRMEP